MKRTLRLFIGLITFAFFSIAGCSSPSLLPVNIVFSNVVVNPPNEFPTVGEVTGTLTNTGDKTADFLQILVKLYDPDGVVATGWNLYNNVVGGEKRNFTISIFDYPTETPVTAKLSWTLTPGGF